MAAVSTIIIHYSAQKRVIIYLLSGFMLFVGMGILANSFGNKPSTNSFVMVLGIIFLLGSLVIIILSRKLFINKTAMVIDDDGLTDNSSSGYNGFIPWGDVIEVKKKKVNGRRIVCVMLKNPNDYIKTGKSLIHKKQMEFNKNFFGTPIVISSRGLDMDYFSLLEMIQRKYNLYNAMEEDSLNMENSSVHL